MSARLALRRRRRRRRRRRLLGSLLVGAWPVSRCEVPLSRSISQIEQKMWWSVWSVKLVLRRFWWPAVDLREVSNYLQRRFQSARQKRVKLFQSVNLKSEVRAKISHFHNLVSLRNVRTRICRSTRSMGSESSAQLALRVTHVTVRSITFRQTAVARVRASRAPPSSSSSGRERDRLHTTTSNDHKQRERRR